MYSSCAASIRARTYGEEMSCEKSLKKWEKSTKVNETVKPQRWRFIYLVRMARSTLNFVPFQSESEMD